MKQRNNDVDRNFVSKEERSLSYLENVVGDLQNKIKSGSALTKEDIDRAQRIGKRLAHIMPELNKASRRATKTIHQAQKQA